MKLSEVGGVGRITKQNTTKDVKPGETKRQAAKFGFTTDSEGRPPELHKKARKNSDPNTLFNLGIGEGLEEAVKQSDVIRVIHNLAARQDNEPFPVKFSNGETLGVKPSTARKILNMLDRFGPKVRQEILTYIDNAVGFKYILKKSGIVEDISESYKDLKPEQMEKWIRFYADRHGVDPDTAVKVWRAEGGMEYQSQVKTGKQQKYRGREDSYGPFQLYRGGGLGNEWEKVYGKNLRTSNDPISVQQQIDFAMQNAAKSGWGQWYGAGRVGIGDNEGIPDKPLSTKYRPIEIIPTDGADVQQKYKPAQSEPSTLDKIGAGLSKAYQAAKPGLDKAADVGADLAKTAGSKAADVAKNIATGNINKDSWAYKNIIKPLTQDIHELRIEKPDPKDTLGVKRRDMPQVKSDDYPEFIDFMKSNGVTFKQETIPAREIKAMQDEFSDAGIIKQLKKNIEQGPNTKPVILSSDDYIIDGHHRWLVAMNTGGDLNVYRVNMPARELYALVNQFDKVYYKDIYDESKGVVTFPLSSGLNVSIIPHRPLKIKKSTPGKNFYAEDMAGFLRMNGVTPRDKNVVQDYMKLKAILKARAEERRKERERMGEDEGSYKVTYTVRGRKFTTVFDTEQERDKFIAAVERAKDYDVVKEAVSAVDLAQLEKFADKIFAKVGIDVEFTRHFMDRVNDPRNDKPITPAELTRLFKQEQKRWGKAIAQMGPGAEAVMKDLQTDINMPFALQWDSANNELDLIAKTVMRKKDFKTPNQEFPVEDIDLEEGVNDPHIFKAIFLAGGPGSGKSFVAKNILGGTGLRSVNSDDVYEFLMKKKGLALDPETIFSPQGQEIRGKAKELTQTRKRTYLDGRIGLIIDGTGKNVDKYAYTKNILESIGYDTAMIYVNTSLQVAQQRNLQRDRSIPAAEVEKMWNEVQENLMKFQQLFGASNFHIIDNSGGLEDIDRQKNFDKVYNETQRFLNTPPKHRKAVAWIQRQKAQNDERRSNQNISSDGGAGDTN